MTWRLESRVILPQKRLPAPLLEIGFNPYAWLN